jgi:hypothetical protein
LEALADQETGLARPAREWSGGLVSSGMQAGGLAGYGKAAAGAIPYLAASVAEDPFVLAGGLAKAAPRTVGKLVKGATAPGRQIAEQAAPVVRGAAERIQQTVLRPRAGDWDAGVDMTAVAKHGVQGTVDEVVQKSQAKIDQAAAQLRQLIQEGKDGGARVNLFQALDNAKARLQKEALADLLARMDPIFNEFRTWAKLEANREGKNRIGSVDLLKAQEFKQMMGTHGAWEKTAAKTRQNITEPERYRSRAAQAVYMTLKDEIEKAAPEGLKELNGTLSELIPIRNAATYRKIVADRNNPIGLSDMLSVMAAVGNGPVGASMLAATRFTKSGFGAKSLYSIAERLEKARTPAEAAFYANKLKAAGLTASEIEALSAGSEILQTPNAIPFRKVAERDSTQPVAMRK